MPVYHFSEEPGIELFEPRTLPASPGGAPCVWAVHPAAAWTYYFPRDCPRILAWPLPSTTPADIAEWSGEGPARPVACIEATWLARMSTTRLYQYAFDPGPFQRLAADPWMLVAHEPLVPIQVTPLGDLVQELADAGVELRVMPSLLPFRNAWETTMHISGIRLRNAAGWDSETPNDDPPPVGGTVRPG